MDAAVDLTTYVHPREAHAFKDAVTLAQQTGDFTRGGGNLESAVAIVSSAARAALGADARVTVAGSVAKGTTVMGSDVDLYVETSKPVSLQQRQALEARLRQHPLTNAAHVQLKLKAIHMQLLGMDIDVVCASTVEYGELPPADASVGADAALQLAVQALKIWARCATGGARKVPGRMMEALAKHCRDARGSSISSSSQQGDGGMQLFVAVLQVIADGGTQQPQLRAATTLDSAGRTALRARAQAVLHVFAVSRVLLSGSEDSDGGFRTAAEVHAWLSGYSGQAPLVHTHAGVAPGWLFMAPAQQRATDAFFADFGGAATAKDTAASRTAASSSEEWTAHDGARIEALRLMLDSPLGVYTTARMQAPAPGALTVHSVMTEITTLNQHAMRGSKVASKMLIARMMWVDGDLALRNGRADEAVELYAASLRASVADGDPFCGWWRADSKYVECADSVLTRNPNSVDAHMLHAWSFMRSGRYKDSERVLTATIERHAPDDTHGVIHLRMCLYGNQGRWVEALQDASRCAALCPDEPIFHYWVAVGRRNTARPEAAAAGAAQTLSALQRFVAHAPPEGRKVPMAWYDIAMQEVLAGRGDARRGDAKFERARNAVRKAQAAEAVTLPVFPATECEAKDTVLKTMAAFGWLPGDGERIKDLLKRLYLGCGDDVNALHKCGNDAFKRRDYYKAEAAYTKALELAPSHVELLSNRAATRLELRWFTAAAADATAAAMLRPDWAKPHARATRAHLGRKDGAAALASARRAAALL
ncbi:hypothetical protein JKP88DRAFT_163496, partial [Tribonema minus]